MTILSKLTKSISNASTKASRKFNVAAASAVKPEGFFNPAPEAENAKPIQPVFWTGTPAIPFEQFQIDCSKFDMKKIVVDTNASGSHSANDIVIDHDFHETKILVDQMSAVFNEVGALQLINTGLTNFDEMEKLSKTVSGKGMWYEGGANLRGYLEKNVYDTGAPRHADLHYHHEMAYVKRAPSGWRFCASTRPRTRRRARRSSRTT